MRALIVSAIISLMFASLPALAAEASEDAISLTLPAGFVEGLCPVLVWKGMTAVWDGTTDDRPEKALGTQTKKGEAPVKVFSAEPLDRVFNAALEKTLAACGMKLVKDAGPEALHLSAKIKTFFAGVEKKLVTGKATAESLITFTAQQGVSTTIVDVGMEIESKDIRRGKLKALQKALQNLFEETLKAIPKARQLQELRAEEQNPAGRIRLMI